MAVLPFHLDGDADTSEDLAPTLETGLLRARLAAVQDERRRQENTMLAVTATSDARHLAALRLAELDALCARLVKALASAAREPSRPSAAW